VTRPLDRNAKLPELGEVDREAGEFWLRNPFLIPSSGNNLSAYERNHLYMNLGAGEFVEASFASRADIDADSRAAVAADFDADGTVDLLVASVGGGPLRLFHNRFPEQGKQMTLSLVGTESNRPGIGARVIAEWGDRRIVRDLFPVNTGVGQSPVQLILGVDDAPKLDRLSIRWPTGAWQRFTDVAVDARVTVTEGSQELEVAPLARNDG
jgi:hypothetical protein